MRVTHTFHVPIDAPGDQPLRVCVERADGTVLVSYPVSHRVSDDDPMVVVMPEGVRGYEIGDSLSAENRPRYGALTRVSIVTHTKDDDTSAPGQRGHYAYEHVPFSRVEEIATMVRSRFATHGVAEAIADAILEQYVISSTSHDDDCPMICRHGRSCVQAIDHESPHTGSGGCCGGELDAEAWRLSDVP